MAKPDNSFEIEVRNRQQRFSCNADQSLLAAMEQQGNKSICVGCRGGGCGLCKIRVLKGQIETKRMSRAHISQAESQQGYALACRTFPRSELVLESDCYQPPGAATTATKPGNTSAMDAHQKPFI
jgi:ferredoxin